MSNKFHATFVWWNGDEQLFLKTIETIAKIHNFDDWITSFHNLRVCALVLNGMSGDVSSFIYNSVKTALHTNNTSWFTPYELSYRSILPDDKLSIAERLFLVEMDSIEHKFGTNRKFSELWYILKNKHNQLPEVGFRKHKNSLKKKVRFIGI